MAINLTKGQTIELRKDAHDLDQITIGLGWKVREKKQGLLSGLFGSKDVEAFDLDAIAFLLEANDKVMSRGDSKLVGGDVVFFNSRQHSSGTVTHMVFGEVYRRNEGWKFRAIGDAHPFDSFVQLLKNHLSN